MASKPQESTKPTLENKNGTYRCPNLISPVLLRKRLTLATTVVGGPLHLFSRQPVTGFYRDGYCRTGPDDVGNHSVAATMTQEFLDYSASAGNNLKEHGVKSGMKWCLCASRWREGFEAAERGAISKEAVPRVHLHASHEKALDVVGYKDLKKYAAEQEASVSGNRQDSHISPQTSGKGAKEHTEIGGDMGTTAPAGGNSAMR